MINDERKIFNGPDRLLSGVFSGKHTCWMLKNSGIDSIPLCNSRWGIRSYMSVAYRDWTGRAGVGRVSGISLLYQRTVPSGTCIYFTAPGSSTVRGQIWINWCQATIQNQNPEYKKGRTVRCRADATNGLTGICFYLVRKYRRAKIPTIFKAGWLHVIIRLL